MANDIEVKRYSWSAGATDTSTTVTIDSVTTANAFCRPINGLFGAHGDGWSHRVAEHTAVPIITGSTTVTVYLVSNSGASPRRGYIEVWEYVGPTGGSSEFKVLHHAKEVISGTSDVTTLSTTATTLGDCVAFRGGVIAPSFSTSEELRGDELQCRVEVTSTSQVTVTRFDGTANVEIGVTVVEFSGSDWTVNKLNDTPATSTDGTSTHSLGFTVASWAKSFYTYTHEVNDGGTGIDDISLIVFPGSASTSQIKTQFNVSTTNVPDFTLYVIEHDSLDVEHNDTIDGTASTVGSYEPSTTITAPTDHDLSTAIGFDLASTNTGTNLSSAAWSAYLSATTTFKTDYGSSFLDENVGYAFQIIDLDAIAGTTGPAMPVIQHHYRHMAGIV